MRPFSTVYGTWHKYIKSVSKSIAASLMVEEWLQHLVPEKKGWA